MESLKGQLLVAAPALVDPNFTRAVVLVTEHTEEGAMGVVLNRPSGASVVDAVPPLAELVPADAQVFVGGPVQQEAVLALAEFEDEDAAAAMVFADVGFLPGELESAALEGVLRRVRVFAGYAGWGAGQLEAELAEPSWFVEPAHADDVFATDADGLWSAILRRKGGHFRLLALMPDDPSRN